MISPMTLKTLGLGGNASVPRHHAEDQRFAVAAIFTELHDAFHLPVAAGVIERGELGYPRSKQGEMGNPLEMDVSMGKSSINGEFSTCHNIYIYYPPISSTPIDQHRCVKPTRYVDNTANGKPWVFPHLYLSLP